jgi:hypothetical protein
VRSDAQNAIKTHTGTKNLLPTVLTIEDMIEGVDVVYAKKHIHKGLKSIEIDYPLLIIEHS